MKYLKYIGLVAIGMGIAVSAHAFTLLKGLEIVENMSLANQGIVTKVLDQDTGTTCYTYSTGNSNASISCVASTSNAVH